MWRKSFLGTSYVVCVELTHEVGVAELVQQLKGCGWEEGKTADMSEQAGGRGVAVSWIKCGVEVENTDCIVLAVGLLS